MKQEELIKIYLQFIKIVICMMFVFSAMVLVNQVKAEDNKTTDFKNSKGIGFPKILDEDEWPSQLVYDTLGACYQGTIKWVILSNPSLLGQAPGPMAMRQMMEHCFCVMDKIRKEVKLEEYVKKVLNPEWGGNLFMLKAVECVGEYETLPSFFMKMPTPDNATKIDNGTVEKLEVLPAVPEGPEESSPDKEIEDQQTILQG